MNDHTPNAAYFSNFRTESVGRVPDPRRVPSPGWLKFQRNPNGRPGGRLRTRASAPQGSTPQGQTLEDEDEFERDRR